MVTKLVPIGNARGVRIPKTLLKRYGLTDLVELSAQRTGLVLRPRRRVRAGWKSAFAGMAAAGDDRLLDEPRETAFDRSEWQW